MRLLRKLWLCYFKFKIAPLESVHQTADIITLSYIITNENLWAPSLYIW